MEKMDARAMVSIVAGVAALMFMFAVDRWMLHTLSLVLGISAVLSGVAVMRAGKKGRVGGRCRARHDRRVLVDPHQGVRIALTLGHE